MLFDKPQAHSTTAKASPALLSTLSTEDKKLASIPRLLSWVTRLLPSPWMLVSWFCAFCTCWQNCWLCEMPAITPAAVPTGAHSAGSALTPAQLLDEIVLSVF